MTRVSKETYLALHNSSDLFRYPLSLRIHYSVSQLDATSNIRLTLSFKNFFIDKSLLRNNIKKFYKMKEHHKQGLN